MYLYLGDDDMSRAAAYLSGVMAYHDISFRRVDSEQSPPEDFGSKRYRGYILSDYPRARFQPEQLDQLQKAVFEGAGLLMIGGWESFHGLLGEYQETVLTEMLPVTMLDRDDRHNHSQPVMLVRKQDHPILDDLPWSYPPFIGGFNEFVAKADATVLLEAIRTSVRIVEEQVLDTDTDSGSLPGQSLSLALPTGESMLVSLNQRYPMLVVGRYGQGRTAALATDVAPHWVGGFVDWYQERIRQDLPNGGFIEVGADYARFFAQLLRWVAGH